MAATVQKTSQTVETSELGGLNYLMQTGSTWWRFAHATSKPRYPMGFVDGHVVPMQLVGGEGYNFYSSRLTLRVNHNW